jgi:hypothetical protein
MTPTHNGHAPASSRIPSTENAMQTSMGHDLTRRDPEVAADILTDAANVAAIALREQSDAKVTCDDDVTVEVDGEDYVVTIPHTVVRVLRSKHREFADQLAKWALEEAGLRQMAASRATEIVWRDMQRVSKS